MKYFFGCTFMSREELANIGVKYPIKLEYYKTQTNEEDVKNINDTIAKISFFIFNIILLNEFLPVLITYIISAKPNYLISSHLQT